MSFFANLVIWGNLGSIPPLERAKKVRFPDARKSALLKASSERLAPHNFVILVTLLNIEINIETYSGTAVSSAFFFL